MEFLRRIRNRYPIPLQEYYDDQQYPLFIWVIELTLQSEVETKAYSERLISGEIILDSTANKYDPCWLFVHINGLVAKRNLATEQIEFQSIGDGEIAPYSSVKH